MVSKLLIKSDFFFLAVSTFVSVRAKRSNSNSGSGHASNILEVCRVYDRLVKSLQEAYLSLSSEEKRILHDEKLRKSLEQSFLDIYIETYVLKEFDIEDVKANIEQAISIMVKSPS